MSHLNDPDLHLLCGNMYLYKVTSVGFGDDPFILKLALLWL